MEYYLAVAVWILGSCGVLRVNGVLTRCLDATPERLHPVENLPPMWPNRTHFSCSTPNIDTAVMTDDKKTYFFKSDYYWKLNGSHVVDGYPRLIEQDWDGLPGELDAAFTWNDGRTFFFKRSQYWAFRNKNMEPGYPKLINEGFCGIPDNLDAAVLWGQNNRVYFFKGRDYWRFDGGAAEEPVSSNYPQLISAWANIPPHLDAALRWENGRTYFIKGTNYYRYNDDGTDRDAGRPVPIPQYWGLSCTQLRSRITNAL